MDLTHEDVQRILKIIDEASHLEELDLQYGDFRLHIRRHGAGERAVPVPATASAQIAKPKTETPVAKGKAAPKPVPEGMVAIRAPMLGTFYRASSPGEKPFVEVGQSVAPDDTVCLIEVMKLFNSIKAGVAGKIAEIRSDNAALVEYNEVLIVIEPSK
jgi:acetyl-CoA carboxylase biotin carboxyl carrier protein